MTTTAAAYASLKTALRDLAWPAPAPKLVYPNMRAPTEGEFVTIRIEHEQTRQRSMGPPGKRSVEERGVLILRVHTAPGEGDARQLAIYQAVKDAMSTVQIDGVILRTATITDSGPFKAWYFFEITIPMEYYEQR